MSLDVPSERTVYRIMAFGGLIYKPKRKPNGIAKANKEAQKSDDLIKRDFVAEEPLKKCVTDITEIPAKDGKLYVSAIFDCFDNAVLGLSMADNMKASLWYYKSVVELCEISHLNNCTYFNIMRE